MEEVYIAITPVGPFIINTNGGYQEALKEVKVKIMRMEAFRKMEFVDAVILLEISDGKLVEIRFIRKGKEVKPREFRKSLNESTLKLFCKDLCYVLNSLCPLPKEWITFLELISRFN
jgi:hypothetical protein